MTMNGGAAAPLSLISVLVRDAAADACSALNLVQAARVLWFLPGLVLAS
jgi:hypothetical protein